jgi:hypothetical protein
MARTETMIDRKIRIQQATSLMMVCVFVYNILGQFGTDEMANSLITSTGWKDAILLI